MQLHLHLVRADLLQGLGQVDLLALHLVPLRLQLLVDVLAGDRPEELVLRSGLAGEPELDGVQLLRHRAHVRLILRRAREDARLVVLELAQVLRRRGHRQLAGQEIVAAIARLHLHHGAGLAQVVHVLREDDFHGRLLLVLHDGVGEQRQVAAALDGGRHLALVARAVSRDAPRDDLAPLGDEVLEVGRVLVVDLEVLVGAVAAHLAPAEAAAAAAVHVVAAAIAALAAIGAAIASAPCAFAVAAFLLVSAVHGHSTSGGSSTSSTSRSPRSRKPSKPAGSSRAARSGISGSPGSFTSASTARALTSTSSEIFTDWYLSTSSVMRR